MKKILYFCLLLLPCSASVRYSTAFDFYEYYTLRRGCLSIIYFYGDATKNNFSRRVISDYLQKVGTETAKQVLIDLIKEKKMPMNWRGKK